MGFRDGVFRDRYIAPPKASPFATLTAPPTILYLRNTQVNGQSIGGVACYDLITTKGSSIDTAETTSTASGTNIQLTKTAGGSVVWFITPRLPLGGWTITRSLLTVWLRESLATVNAAGRFRLHKWTAGSLTLIVGSPFDSTLEIDVINTEYTWEGDVTDTFIAEDERLVLELDITNIGTMGAGTVTLSFNGAD